MFTVCPKCALTLVVTAADLRVAQGYVRCGRCSNVFNALSRLSEDRQAAAAAAQSQAPQAPQESAPAPPPKQPAPPQQRPDTSGTFRMGGSSRVRKATPPPPPPAQEPKRYDDDSIPEEDLEFNPDATDLNKVFVEQPPSPQFTAATGTFKAIRLEAEGSGHSMEPLEETDERENVTREDFDPTDTQVDVELDPDLLLEQLTSNRLQRLNATPPEPAPPEPAPKASPREPPSQKASATAKHPLLLQPPLEQPPQTPPPMRLAERAKARAEAARTGADPGRTPNVGLRPDAKQKLNGPDSKPRQETQRASAGALETARRPVKGKEVGEPDGAFAISTSQAIRDALAPRRRSALSDITSTSGEQPTSFFAGIWTAGSIALLLLLTIQVVHHYRHDLATNATLNGPLTSIYAVLGIPLVPRWDLNAYEVRQLGAQAAGEGQISVRASVKNGARQAQPLPLLRVTLQDRFGNRIASRDVPPQSYLPRAIPSSSLLSAGQRIDAEMTFVDPGSNAVGFEIDACLPAPGGGISCANDIAR